MGLIDVFANFIVRYFTHANADLTMQILKTMVKEINSLIKIIIRADPHNKAYLIDWEKSFIDLSLDKRVEMKQYGFSGIINLIADDPRRSIK